MWDYSHYVILKTSKCKRENGKESRLWFMILTLAKNDSWSVWPTGDRLIKLLENVSWLTYTSPINYSAKIITFWLHLSVITVMTSKQVLPMNYWLQLKLHRRRHHLHMHKKPTQEHWIRFRNQTGLFLPKLLRLTRCLTPALSQGSYGFSASQANVYFP